MPPLSLPIIHRCDRYVVIDKPSGLLSVPGKGPHGVDCVPWRIKLMFPGATGPLTVHRLDMETSGLMVVALDEDAQRRLSMQFEGRSVDKAYTALLEGDLPADEGEVRLPLRPDLSARPRQIVDLVHGMRAHTRWRVLARENGHTRVEFRPTTGRTHQLRVHAATPRDAFPDRGGGMGAPILGDSLYGRRDAAPRLMLHASYLAFDNLDAPGRVEFRSASPF